MMVQERSLQMFLEEAELSPTRESSRRYDPVVVFLDKVSKAARDTSPLPSSMQDHALTQSPLLAG